VPCFALASTCVMLLLRDLVVQVVDASREGDKGSWILEAGHGTPLPVAWEHFVVPEGQRHAPRDGGEALYSLAQNKTECPGSGAMADCIRGRNTHSKIQFTHIWKNGALKLIFSALRCI